MTTYQGFTLTEVLIAFVLITCASLGLLTQQWQIAQLLNQWLQHAQSSRTKDNQIECLRAKYPDNVRPVSTVSKSNNLFLFNRSRQVCDD